MGFSGGLFLLNNLLFNQMINHGQTEVSVSVLI